MLTDVEYRYLRRNKRLFRMTRAKAVNALAIAGVPQLPVFIEFQSVYGGYRPDEDFVFGIVGPANEHDGEPRSRSFHQLCVARCDLCNRMQIRLGIDERGHFYFEDQVVAESFESYIRFKAYCDMKLAPMAWTFIDNERRATKRYRKIFDRLGVAELVDSVSDPFHSVRMCEQYFETEIAGNRRLFVRPDILSKGT